MKLTDGLKSLISGLTNKRTATATNRFVSGRLDREEMRAIYKTGLGNKICRLKAGYALDDTLNFDSNDDKEYWANVLKPSVYTAAKFMVAYGRGIIVLHHLGDDLGQPLSKGIKREGLILSAFSGELVTVGQVSHDLQSGHYHKPLTYMVEGVSVHHSRVIDFKYVQPPEREDSLYQYGGISEFELIYNQLVNDGVIERGSAHIIEKASTFVYSIEGFKEAMAAGDEAEIAAYFEGMESLRGLFGSVIIDATDSAESISQSITNLSEVNDMSLRRIAMVTGIPLTVLVGEAAKGLNSSGDNERDALIDMVQQFHFQFLQEPLWHLFDLLGFGKRNWAEDMGVTDRDRAEFEAKIIDNAFKLWQMGADHEQYLSDKGIGEVDGVDSFWNAEPEPDDTDELTDPSKPQPDPFQDALTDALKRVTATTKD